ncbi:kinase-like domain-containing protein [Cubamyces menziesii]|nr:kinase-like domain-containing protein [Cubamyces menziesii]
MSTNPTSRKPPIYAVLSDAAVERQVRMTAEGVYDLAPSEVFWQQRQQYLEEAGYSLRPRYRPNWRPSWIGTNLAPRYCEDSILLTDYQVMDATCIATNELVAIKSFTKDTEELQIAQFFSSIKDPTNHCVPVHQMLPDPFDHEKALMVMPYLRPCNNPDWSTLGDVVDFVTQTLEGLTFMHRHRVAHCDISIPNIMMDAKPLYPDGHHPVRLNFAPDGMHRVTPLPRAGRSIRYYYIDFGLALQFQPGVTPTALGRVGRDREVPELSDTVPYDPLKVDIFALGHLYSQEFEKKYDSMEFLIPLIELMTRREPTERADAEQLLLKWEEIRRDLNKSSFRWRLAPKGEPAIERVLNDTVAVAWHGISHLKSLVS